MINVQENISLKEFTTFKIGGLARYFVIVEHAQDLPEALDFADEKKIKYVILAGGSNVLISDDGFDGLVIHMRNDTIKIDGADITIGAGADLMDLVLFSTKNGLSGMEKMAGIPGSVGGAVRGNAGAFGVETKDTLWSVEAYDTKKREIVTFTREKCHFSYRSSVFKSEGLYIILRATFRFERGQRDEIERVVYDTIGKRNSRHIQNIMSAGSFFINPTVNEEVQKRFLEDRGVESRGGRVPAGWLLESVGIDQKKIGGIQAGLTHSNYFINDGTGTAEQAVQLAAVARSRVRNEFGVQLREEVTLVGF